MLERTRISTKLMALHALSEKKREEQQEKRKSEEHWKRKISCYIPHGF
ncbi:hypothetical protein SLEP1_g1040 [Rubroshorea leprosula]|uniref:Uncharacterized protein n=1 Tax=Rubroshorea leprosula TaxID=152421 RepID=A0AAV5HCI9_9ROSI|nr:hypothetical protein SLEP1_g1040 [Rubroshorea leprosula]